MKKLFVSLVLVAVGAGAWWLLSQTARFSIKRWDAKFGSVVRQELNALGLSNEDIVSVVNQVQKDSRGEWVVQRLSVKLADPEKQRALKLQLENAGATVLEKTTEQNGLVYIVNRGSRTYQEITFQKP